VRVSIGLALSSLFFLLFATVSSLLIVMSLLLFLLLAFLFFASAESVRCPASEFLSVLQLRARRKASPYFCAILLPVFFRNQLLLITHRDDAFSNIHIIFSIPPVCVVTFPGLCEFVQKHRLFFSFTFLFITLSLHPFACCFSLHAFSSMFGLVGPSFLLLAVINAIGTGSIL